MKKKLLSFFGLSLSCTFAQAVIIIHNESSYVKKIHLIYSGQEQDIFGKFLVPGASFESDRNICKIINEMTGEPLRVIEDKTGYTVISITDAQCKVDSYYNPLNCDKCVLS